ncbi:MAG: hypothetical protein ACJ8F7_10395, partial [Gemmataceae bacterium]
ALFWWFPLAWLARRELRRVEEECCDGRVLELLPDSARTYAEALLDTIDFLAEAPALPATASGLGAAEMLKRRLLMILHGAPRPRLTTAGRLSLLALALGLLPVLAAPQQKTAAPTAPVGPAATAAAFPPGEEPFLYMQQPTNLQTAPPRWWSLAQSRDNKLIAVTAGNHEQKGEIFLFDSASGAVKGTINHTSGIRCAAFSPDGKTLAAGSFDNSVRLYDVATLKLKAVGAGHSGAVNGIAWSDDGKLLVTGALDKSIRVWQAPNLPPAVVEVAKPGAAPTAPAPVEAPKTESTTTPDAEMPVPQDAPKPSAKAKPTEEKKPLQFTAFATLEGHSDWVLSVALSKDGKTIVSGSRDSSARVWDAPAPPADGKPVTITKQRLELKGHTSGVECVAISADGASAATGSWDATVRTWNLKDGSVVRSITGLPGGANGLALSPDGKEIAVATGNSDSGQGGQVTRFSLDNGNRLNIINHPQASRSVSYSADGQTLLSLGEERVILRTGLKQGMVRGQINAPPSAADAPQIVLGVAYSRDGKQFAIAGENKKITVFTLPDKHSRSWVGHDDVVAGLAFSPDGKTLASASHDRTVKVWDLANWKAGQPTPPVKVLKGHTNWVFTVAYSHDGKKLATGGYDKTARLWDLTNWTTDQPPVMVLKAHSAGVRCVAFSPDDKLLATSGADRSIRVWTVASGDQAGIIRGHKGAIRGLAFSPDGKTLASGSEDKTVKLWALTADKDGNVTGKERAELGPHNDMVGAIVFSPKGRTLAAATWTGQIYLWDPDLAKRRAILNGHQDGVEALAFSPDSLTLASGSLDKTVKFWPAQPPPSPGAVAYAGHGDAVFAIALSRDGKWTATGCRDGAVRVYQRDGGQPAFTAAGAHPGGVTHLAYSPDGQLLASVGKDKTVRLWNAATGAKIRQFPAHSEEITWVAFSPDGKTLATASKDKTAAVWSVADGKPVQKLDGFTEEVTCVVFSPDGKTLAAGSMDRTYKVWDTQKWESKFASVQTPNTGHVLALAFSPDNKTLAVAHSQDQEIGPDGDQIRQQTRNVMLIDATTGKPQGGSQFQHPDWITAVVYSADGQTLITACRDFNIRFWSLKSGQQQRTFRAHNAGIADLALADDVLATAGEDRLATLWAAVLKQQAPRGFLTGHAGQVWFAELSKDGTRLATGGTDKRVQLRDGFRGTQPFTFAGPFAAVNSVAASRDGKLIASGHRDGKIEIWDGASGKKVKTLAGHTMTVWSLAFSADGKTLFSCSGSWEAKEKPGEVRMWDVDGGKPIREFSGHAGLVYHVALSPDGRMIATASHDQTLRLWDVGSGKPLHTLKVPGQSVRSVEFAPDGQTLVSASNVSVNLSADSVRPDGTIIFWDVKAAKEKSRFAVPNGMQANRAKYSPDGKTVVIAANIPKPAAGQAMLVPAEFSDGVVPPAMMAPQQYGGRLLFWDVEKGSFRGEGKPPMNEMILDVAFLPGGYTVAAVGGEYGTVGNVRFYDAVYGNRVGDLVGHQLWCEAVAVLPDGRVVSAGGVHDKPGEMKIWHAKGVRPMRGLEGHSTTVTCAAFSPDLKELATGDAKGEIYLWDVTVWPPKGLVARKTLPGLGSMVRGLIYNADGKTLISAADAGRVIVWDVETGDEKLSFQATGKKLYGLALSPDGKLLVTTAGNWQQTTTGEVKIWNAATGTLVKELPNFQRHAWTPAFSPDGKLLAVSGGQNTVRIYDTTNWNEKSRLPVTVGVRALAFSPDGKTIATASETNNDPVVRLWDADTGRERIALSGLAELVFQLRFAADGKSLFAACGDNRVLMWDVPAPKTAMAQK